MSKAKETTALFRRYPELAGRIPWLPLCAGPTPVERVDPDALGFPGAELWVKRDDLTSPLYGGNKVRKLEFLLAWARRKGARRVITAGAAGSHHALATTVHARGLGLKVSLVLFPQHLTPKVRQVLLLDHAYGAELRFTSRMQFVPAAMLAARMAHLPDRPHVIPPGGSDAVGTLGYVSAALELAEQVAAGEAPVPDVVHVTAGTLGTVAGLALGLSLAGLPTRIHATRVTSRIVTNERVLRRLVRGAARVLHAAGLPVEPEDALRRVVLRHDQIGAGYGRETPAGRAAAERFEASGLALDATYTAKTAASLLDELDDGVTGTHLYWHTLSAGLPIEAAEGVGPNSLPAPFRDFLAAGG